eukprot:2705415-Amphidinium_carterae.1
MKKTKKTTKLNQLTTAAENINKNIMRRTKSSGKGRGKRYTTKVLRNDDRPLQTLPHQKISDDHALLREFSKDPYNYRRFQRDRHKT